MKITYVGRHSCGVEVGPDAIPVGHGETVDLPDDVATSLLRQTGQWKKAPTKKAEPAATDKESS